MRPPAKNGQTKIITSVDQESIQCNDLQCEEQKNMRGNGFSFLIALSIFGKGPCKEDHLLFFAMVYTWMQFYAHSRLQDQACKYI